jgi:50S ribosomal protein L16 3-hydroxylase
MISYAPVGGSVGPHIDAYDVFLLQLHGRRKWMINTKHSNKFLDDTDLKILSNFEAEDEWILEPGDILYLPPNMAHHGVAIEPCMTCSIGFRAPSARSMVSEFGEYLASKLSHDHHYSDKEIQNQDHPAEISQSALTKIKDILSHSFVADNNVMERWFGEYITDTRSSANETSDQDIIVNYEQLEAILEKNETLLHGPASRFAFIRDNKNAILFVDGLSYNTSIKFSEKICEHHNLSCSLMLEVVDTDQDKKALVDIFNRGGLSLSHV